jgi:methanogenic corrinoid protein MtbC1
MLDTFVKKAIKLEPVPPEATEAYHSNSEKLVAQVNREITGRGDLRTLIGDNSFNVLFDNHRHHVSFMDSVFYFNNFEMLARNLPWVYRTYISRGFSPDYFPAVLGAWIGAIQLHIDPATRDPLLRVYEWMLESHRDILELSAQEELFQGPVEGSAIGHAASRFVDSLLKQDLRRSMQLAMEMVRSGMEVEALYLEVLQPSLYRIGTLWESGKISVAHEHLASATVTRIMAAIYAERVTTRRNMGKVVVTSSPNEYHEIGAWMVSDMLELHGWDVRYLGANTPKEDLLNLLEAFRPDILGISVTMPFNLRNADGIVSAVRKNSTFGHMKIMMGGALFNVMGELYKNMGADGSARNVKGACRLAAQWYQEEVT